MPLAPFPRARLQASVAVAGTTFIWWWRGGPVSAGLALAAALLALVAWAAPARYAPVQRALDRVVHGGLAALTWVLLGLVYFLLFTPLRLLRSFTGRDPLARRREPGAASCLRPLPPGPSRFDRQF